jgi:CHAT domain-containing protein
VSDYSSPRLMQELYAGLAASQSPADALRAAKLALIHSGKYADPYYWGAFQLYEGAL